MTYNLGQLKMGNFFVTLSERIGKKKFVEDFLLMDGNVSGVEKSYFFPLTGVSVSRKSKLFRTRASPPAGSRPYFNSLCT